MTTPVIALLDGGDGLLHFADLSLNVKTPSLRGCRWTDSRDKATRFDSEAAARSALDAADAGEDILVLPESEPFHLPVLPKARPELSRRTNRMHHKTS